MLRHSQSDTALKFGVTLFATSLLLLAVTSSLVAQTTNWKTVAGNGSWNVAGNWTAGIPDSSTVANFTSSNFTTTTIDGDKDVKGLTFSGASNFTVNNSSGVLFTRGSGITVNGGTQIFNEEVRPRTTQSITNNGGGLLDFNSQMLFHLLSSTGTATITFDGSGDIDLRSYAQRVDTYGGIDIVKDGAGTLTIENAPNANGITSFPVDGTFTIQDGTVLLGADNAISTASSLVVEGGATFNMSSFDAEVVNLTVNKNGASGAVVATGGRDLTVTGLVMLNDGVDLTNTNVKVKFSGAATGLTVADTGSATDFTDLRFDIDLGGAERTFDIGDLTGGSDVVYRGDITGAAGSEFVKKGAGAFKLVTGTISVDLIDIQAGTLFIQNESDRIGNSTDLTVSGGTFNFLGASETDTVGRVTLESGTLTGSGVLTGSSSHQVQSGTLDLTLAGNQILVKTTGGTVTVTDEQAYTGRTVIQSSGGTLSISADNHLGAAPGSATPGHLEIKGGATLQTTASFTLDANRGIELGNSGGSGTGTIDVASGTVLTYNGIITDYAPGSGSGVDSLRKLGDGTLALGGNNSYGGTTMLDGGILQVTHNSALSSGALTFDGGTRLVIQNGRTISNDITIGANAGVAGRGLIENSAGGGNATLSGGTITINSGASAGGHFASATNGTLTVNSVINSASTTVTWRDGTGIFGGGGSYDDFKINEGTVRLGANGGLSTDATLNIGASNPSTFDMAGFNQTLVGITKGSSTATIGNSSTTSDSILTTTGTSTYAGVIQDTVGAGDKKVKLRVNGGTLTLSGSDNTYSGGTEIGVGQGPGVLRAAATQALGTGDVLIGPGGGNTTALLELSGGISLNNDVIVRGRGGSTTNMTPAIQNISGNNKLSGILSIHTGGANWIIQSDADQLELSGTLTTTSSATGGRIWTFQGDGNTLVSGDINSGSSDPMSVKKNGTGMLTLSGTNALTGDFDVNGGTLLINGGSTELTTANDVFVDGVGTKFDVSGTGTLANIQSLHIDNGATGGVSDGATLNILGNTTTVNGAGTLFITGSSNLNESMDLIVADGAGETGLVDQNTGGNAKIDGNTIIARNGGNFGTWTALPNSGSAIIGSGASSDFDIAIRDTGNNTTRGTVDLSGTSSTTINVANLRIGNNTAGTGSNSTVSGELTLSSAGTNTITADAIRLGYVDGGGGGTTSGTLNFGGAANNVSTNTFTVGSDKGVGTVTIAAGGTLTLGGKLGAEADLFIGNNSNPTTNSNPTLSHMNLTGGTFNATLDAVVIGAYASSGTGSGKGELTFEAGTSTANSVLLGQSNGSNPTSTTGKVNQNGGSLTVANNMTVGDGGIGTYNLAAGTLSFNDRDGTTQASNGADSTLFVNAGSAFNFDGGVLENVTTIDVATSASPFTVGNGDAIGARFVIGHDGLTMLTGAERAITTIQEAGGGTNGIDFLLNSDGTLAFDIFGPGSHGINGEQAGSLAIDPLSMSLDSDILHVTGDSFLNGFLDIEDNGYGMGPFRWYDVLLSDGLINTDGLAFSDDSDATFFRVVDNPFGAGQLLQVAVPEPASLVLWAMLGVIGFLAYRRTRR